MTRLGWTAGRTQRLGSYGPSRVCCSPGAISGKILLPAFLGTHLPLAVLVAYLLLVSGRGPADATRVLGVALAATLAGSALTLLGLWVLLSPVTAASRALRAYRESGALPDLTASLPEGAGADDEAARMLADVEGTVSDLAEWDPLTGLHAPTIWS